MPAAAAERAHRSRTGSRCAWVVRLVLGLPLLASACAPTPPPGSAYRALRDTTDSLLAAGRPEDAVRSLRAAATGEAMPRAASWERAWAAARARALEPVLAAPPAGRAELAATRRPLARDVAEEPDDWATLRPALERQFAARRRWLGPDSPELAATMVALARLERTRGDRLRGLDLDFEALRIRRAAFGAQSPEVAECQLMLGRDLKRASSLVDRPEGHVDTALAIRRLRFGERSPEYAEALAAQANLLRWEDQPRPALVEFGHARDLFARAGPRYEAALAGVEADMAVTEMREGHWERLERLARAAVARLDARGDTTSAASAYSLSVLGLALRRMERWAEARAVLGRATRVEEARRRSAPADYFVRLEAYALPSYLELAMVQLAMGDSVAAWETQERGLSRWCAERAWARGEMDSATTWNGLLARVQARLTDASAVIGWLDPFYLPGSRINPNWTYVIRRTGPVHWAETRAAASVALHDDVATRLRGRLRIAAAWPFRITRFPDVVADQHTAWQRRFRAAEPFLAGVRELIVISPNVDYETPLEIAIDSTGRALDERFAISYSPSALHFASSPRPDRDGRSRREWSSLVLRAPGRPTPDGSDDLAAGDAEVRELVGRVRHPVVLTGAAASEERIRSLARSGALAELDLLHVTSHAAAPDEWTDEVGLTLAEAMPGGHPAPGAPGDRDGILTVEDIRNWRLRARLVTLASCTSAGQVPKHTEGLPGLGSGFLAAGARSVLVSLWPVDDEATAILMRDFYEALFEDRARPCSTAEALREARERLRNYRDASGDRPYAHPARWGGYVLLGDPG